MINKARILTLSILFKFDIVLQILATHGKTAITIIIEMHYRNKDIKLFLLAKT